MNKQPEALPYGYMSDCGIFQKEKPEIILGIGEKWNFDSRKFWSGLAQVATPNS